MNRVHQAFCCMFLFILFGNLIACKSNKNISSLNKNVQNHIFFTAEFDSSFNTEKWKNKWGIEWTNRTDECEIVPLKPNQSALRVFYPEGAVGPAEGGAQFPMVFSNTKELENTDGFKSLTLKYQLKFEEGFDFRLGGKLPGLMGGGDSWARSGGTQPDGANGWTMRFMWRTDGELVVYAYLPPSENQKWGGKQWGQDIDCNFFFEPDKWYVIEQHVNVGTPGKDDGKLIVKVDGVELLTLDDLRYGDINNEYHKIGGIFFSTFHGGNSSGWGPLNDSYLQFASFEVFN